uniref:Uncharacterized protein n=1 Tax=Leersia perrieri TaxID=77586 RepID=A0A0D9UX86_9ORYZ
MVRKPITSRHGEAAAAVNAGDMAAAEERERKGLWSPEEDERLYTHITRCGVSTWSSVIGLRRSGKSCRLRWMNYLRPDLKKEPITDREAETIISLQKLLGNRWSVIAAKMPGRTDNEIKNYWNSRIRKRQTAAAAVAESRAKTEPPALAAGDEPCADAAAVEATAAAPSSPPPIAARLPVFACQLLDGGAVAATQSSPTATEQLVNGAGSSESEASAGGNGGGGEDYSYSGGGVDGDMVRHLLALDDLDLLIDVPGLLDSWECELYYPEDSSSSMSN